MYCELGGEQEETLAEIAATSKPIGAVIAGYCGEMFGDGMQFGHASNLVIGDKGSARAKADALRSAGVTILRDLGEVQEWVAAPRAKPQGVAR